MHLRKCFTEFMVVGLGKGNREFHHFKDTDKIKLEPEPNNRYDKNAIKVLANGVFVGYVARDYTNDLHKFLNRTDSDQNQHLLEFYLVDKYSASARYLTIDLTLSLKRKLKQK